MKLSDSEAANLCNADLREIELRNANLAGANLNRAFLPLANLSNANLEGSNLSYAVLVGAHLNDSKLAWADLSNAALTVANLSNADLKETNLSNADLVVANLNNATLVEATLNNANLAGANLNNANLSKAQLKQANLDGVSLSGAQFSNANLAGARYAPVSGAPDPNVAGIKGLATVTFPHGAETGLVQLRDLLQKAGLRNLEREATFAIENGKTGHAIKGDNPGDVAEGYFRLMAFDWTTGYGLYPGRALRVIAVVWLLLILVYFWPIRLIPHRTSVAGIYQVWPSDRVETSGSNAAIGKSVTVNRLQRATVAALGYAAYFSLLSAFHIGWRDLNVGTWIARIQAREYALRATGWVRAVSGVQSLLSVYLLAMWALTYFGRPFQ